jgi:hypothetical protein
MIHHGIHAALARERMSTFLAQAEAGRLARQARRRPKGGRVWLRDGSAVLIRPVRPADDGLWRYFTDVDAAMAGLLQNFGGDLVRREFGTVEYEIELSCRVTRPLRTA